MGKIMKKTLLAAEKKLRESGVVGPYLVIAPKSAKRLVESCGLTYAGDDPSIAYEPRER